MNTQAALDRALSILVEKAQLDLGLLRGSLVRAGLSQAQSYEIIEFVPLAFGRALMDGMGVLFDDEYVRIDGEGRERLRKKLADEPMFVAALAAAPKVMQTAGQDAFAAIAMRSAELDAVNNALNAGVDADGLIASSPVMKWSDDLPTAAPAAKPWWKVW